MPLALTRQSDVSLPLSVAVSEFLCECRLRQLSPSTLQWYQYSLEPFVRFAAARGEPEVAAVTVQTVRAFLADQATRVQARRVNHYREALDRLFQWLIVEGHVTENPAAGINKAREAKRLIAAFSQEEVEALLRQPDTSGFIGLRDHTFMLLLLDTGIRLSEALGLRVSDVDLKAGVLKAFGKGRKERLVGVSPTLAGNLRRYLVRRAAALAGAGKEDCPWLLPSQCGGKGTAKGFQQRLARYGREAGLSRVRVSPHTFRHTFALWFVRNGGSPFHLQKILGHTSLDMSRRYCELADVDFISRQQQLSPLAMTDLGTKRPKRLR
jgi:integrase/recombinase XerD